MSPQTNDSATKQLPCSKDAFGERRLLIGWLTDCFIQNLSWVWSHRVRGGPNIAFYALRLARFWFARVQTRRGLSIPRTCAPDCFLTVFGGLRHGLCQCTRGGHRLRKQRTVDVTKWHEGLHKVLRERPKQQCSFEATHPPPPPPPLDTFLRVDAW